MYVAKLLSQELGGVHTYDSIEELKGCQGAIQASTGGGLVVSATVEDVKRLRSHMKGIDSNLYVILVGCDETSIEASARSNQKTLMGLVRAWQHNHHAAMVVNVASSPVWEAQAVTDSMDTDQILPFEAGEELKRVAMQLMKHSNQNQAMDIRRGLLVFFPGIPGCGKSALSGAASQQLLKTFLATYQVDELSQCPPRELNVVVGDRVRGSYWKHIHQLRHRHPATVLIADKNVPRDTWSIVGASAGNRSESTRLNSSHVD